MDERVSSSCEFNPKHCRPSTQPPSDGDCPNAATVSLGADGKWHVCDSCAELVYFNRFRVRTKLRSAVSASGQP